MIRLSTIVLVVAQLYCIGREIPYLSRSGDIVDITTFSLYIARLFNLVAFVPTLLACYLRPATLGRWSLAIGLLCGIDIGLTAAIQARVGGTVGLEIFLACLMMVIQAIYIGIRWFAYGPADFDEPVLKLEISSAESEGDSKLLDRNAQQSKVRYSTCRHALSGTNRAPPQPPSLSLPTAHLKLLLTLCPDRRHCPSSCTQ